MPRKRNHDNKKKFKHGSSSSSSSKSSSKSSSSKSSSSSTSFSLSSDLLSIERLYKMFRKFVRYIIRRIRRIEIRIFGSTPADPNAPFDPMTPIIPGTVIPGAPGDPRISAFCNITNTNVQTIPLGAPILFTDNAHQLVVNITHAPGSSDIIINQEGVYLFEAIISTNEPCQFTLFKNGIPQNDTTTGTNTGAGQLVMRRILFFNAGDKLNLVNSQSSKGTVTLVNNAGGSLIGSNAIFSLIRIASGSAIIGQTGAQLGAQMGQLAQS